MLKGFKDFLMRGNVVDLAVAVVIGTAFTAIITSITEHLIQPLIAAIGGTNVSGLSWTIVAGNEASRIDFAAVITAMLNFLIVAAVVYFLLVFPMKKVQERRKRGEEPGPSEPTDIELLTEIRDLLQQQSGLSHSQPTPQHGFAQQSPPQQAPPGPMPPQQPPLQQPHTQAPPMQQAPSQAPPAQQPPTQAPPTQQPPNQPPPNQQPPTQAPPTQQPPTQPPPVQQPPHQPPGDQGGYPPNRGS
ncbi:large-conductance mechanosensitive channel protein MscL [Actinophytocola sp. S1-96]|uniref:Large-conductance mechanosensitive channel n=1 Tax=Actinophytocola gossypii TaxID=2812003 RepID=A0ABT2J514_9PSEU|nr:large-conductance mechanosensitive channel protein MscL [Actinophytocola gossypii]